MRPSPHWLAALFGLLAVGAVAQTMPTQGDRELSVVNHGHRTMNEIYVSPRSADDWGADQLGDATVQPGNTARLRLGRTRECRFDIQIVYDDASREVQHDIDVCSARQLAFDGSHAVLPPGADGGAHRVVVRDASARPIQQVLISSAASGDWGDDLLRHTSISVGDSATITYTGECVADLRVVFDNRSAEERRSLDLCQLGGVAIQPGWTTADTLPAMAAPALGNTEDLRVTVENQSGHDATALFLTPDGVPMAPRGPDLLGSSVLANGDRASISFARPHGVCRFSAHVVFGGKMADQDLTGLDLCQAPAISLSRKA